MKNVLRKISLSWFIMVLFFTMTAFVTSVSSNKATTLQKQNKEISLALANTDGVGYYDELLISALKAAGYKVNVKRTMKEPQARAMKDLDAGKISLYYMVQSAERDSKYKSVNVGLTNGLIGTRILFIKKGDQSRFDQIKTLKNLQESNLTGAMGINWFDVKVWDTNALKYHGVDGDWNCIYKMIEAGNRNVDYFARGLNEIVGEAQNHPELDIEENLVLKYDRDFKIYFSKSGEKMKNVIEAAMKNAKKTGLIDKMVTKYYGKDIISLNYNKRLIIKMATPK